MRSQKPKNLGRWLWLGFVIPILAEFLVSILIVNFDSGAYAEGFSYVVVIVMLILAIPITLLGNAVLVPRQVAENTSYFSRSMILPSLFTAVVLVYYTGLWDKVIMDKVVEPLFPTPVEKIQYSGGGRLDKNTRESFIIVNEYTGSREDLTALETYAQDRFADLSRRCPECLEIDVYYYFVPSESYDPVYKDVSRRRSVAVYRHLSTDETATIEQIKP